MSVTIEFPKVIYGFKERHCITSEMKRVISNLMNFNQKFNTNIKVGIVPIEYHMTKEEKSQGLMGRYGPAGPMSGEEKKWHTLPVLPYNHMTLKITTEYVQSNDIDLIIHDLNLLKNSKSRDGTDSLKTYNITDVYEQKNIQKAIYKLPGFDEAFQSIKKMIPNLKKSEFIQYQNVEGYSYRENFRNLKFFDEVINDSHLSLNGDIVKCDQYDENNKENIIATYDETVSIPTEKKTLYIEIIASDLEKNIPTISLIYQTLNQIRY